MMRFLRGEIQPKPYQLGLIGPADMDPAYLPFVIRTINRLTWRLPNLEILVHGFKERLSHLVIGGVETVAALYAKRYWYTLKVYRDFKVIRVPHTGWGNFVQTDAAFFRDSAGFVVFDDGSYLVRQHKLDAKSAMIKKVKTFKLPEIPV